MAHDNDPGWNPANPAENPFVNENSIEAQMEQSPTAGDNGDGQQYDSNDPGMVAPPDDISYPEDRLGTEVSATLADRLGVGDRLVIQNKNVLLARLQVSGSYLSVQSGWRLELRVDVDRPGALNMASFDFFQAGASTTYWGSFRMNSPTITYTATQAMLEGPLTGTRSMWANRARIVIPRNLIAQRAAAATLTFFQNTSPGTVYTCPFRSRYFRSVQLETDVEAGTTLLGSYNTGTFPNPGPTRTLNVVSAYQEAGVDMVYTGRNNVINTSEAGGDSKWTETEMHASMVRHFSIFRNQPQWAVWAFAARRATSGSLLGIMFDYQCQLPHRQGCAIFQDTLANYHSGSDYTRNQLYTYIHELGHAFNLLHSWDKARPDSLSWMNYPWKYDQRNGNGSFWANFTFAFDRQELVHLRHGFYNNVVMGGNDWAVGAGLEAPHSHADDLSLDIVENNTGLKLELQPVRSSFMLGEPVVVEIKLRSRQREERVVNANIHPKYEQVQIGIMRPDGRIMAYEPVGHNCMAEKLESLSEEADTLYASAYIGYGRQGFYFDSPGMYRLKAAYRTQDGSLVQSSEVKIRVKSPHNATDDHIADAYLQDDVGMLFYLLGSDCPALQHGNDLLKEVASKYPKNHLALYADFILGVNEGMAFKTVDPQRSSGIELRKRDVNAAGTHLEKVFAESAGDSGLDNITLNWTYRHLASGLQKEGDDKGAAMLLKRMEERFKSKKLKPFVMEKIKGQIKALLGEK